MEKHAAPHQPAAGPELTATIELFSGRNFEHALDDITTWPFIWVLFWFHHNSGWRPKVQPPRSPRRRGVFATRSPHRPNPIGLSVVRLDAVLGLRLRISGVDILDGTPVLDIKPYVPHVDIVDGAQGGWFQEDPVVEFDVVFAPGAARAMAYLSEVWGIKLEGRIRQALRFGPEPRPYRRIRQTKTGCVLALKDWRAEFETSGHEIRVLRIQSGYAPRQLLDLEREELIAHRAFLEQSL